LEEKKAREERQHKQQPKENRKVKNAGNRKRNLSYARFLWHQAFLCKMGNTVEKRANDPTQAVSANGALQNGRKSLSRRSTGDVVKQILGKGSISQKYDVDFSNVLGKGHYAVVNLARNRETKEEVAVKRIQINRSRVEALKQEIMVLMEVEQHPNIVELKDVYLTDHEVLLVMELLRGGELFDRMVERGPYSEMEASRHIRKIGEALQFLHNKGIVHRDLKPENLILVDKSDDAELKIADFGLSKIVEDVASSVMQTVCGTWAYAAPEVKPAVMTPGAKARYTAKVDLWSTGVILFVILGAYHPFDPDGNCSDGQLWMNICKGEFSFDDPAWHGISDLAKDLIKRLIVVDPLKRYGTEELLAHPWITQNVIVPRTPIAPAIDTNLLKFVERGKYGFSPRPVNGAAPKTQHVPSNGQTMKQVSIKQPGQRDSNDMEIDE
jgi:serine/threonine protein kinase